MPLKKGSSRAVVSQNIREMIAAGHPQNQAVAAALRVARDARKKRRADGGSVDDLPDVGPPLVSAGPSWPGTDIGNRAADIGSRLVANTATGLATLPRRAIENSAYSLDSGTYDPSAPMEAATTMMGAASPFASVSGAGETALGVVPVNIGKAFKGVESRLPESETFQRAVAGTPGARIEDGSLVLPMQRNQVPEQELEPSTRGGVFYLPEGSPNAKHYRGATNYGGTQPIKGETAIKAPLFVKGATGGKAPEVAYQQLMGKPAFEDMQKDVQRSVGAYYLPRDDKIELVRQFLEKHAPELEDHAHYIFSNSQKGNQLRYALQEAAVGSAARRAGHDAIVGYSTKRGGTKEPFFSEVFDVRESHYPGTAGEYEMHPESSFGKKNGGAIDKALRIAKAAGGGVFSGYIPGTTGGRTDNKDISVAAGSYIIPADILSGLGEGNSHAGAASVASHLKMGPYAEAQPYGKAITRPYAKADGGGIESPGAPVPIVAASGEMVIPPEKVAEVGGGDLDRGHSILDAMVQHVRKRTIKTLKKLPKPRKD
ncbi:hypothetical protein [Bradyrhizobium cenepequi]|uniref:hypothetical protein n=1 Tax=Bradyrhizobium cenepequi TaxID=2821403 RepID=UPI001CE24D4F|nr:hypothetical protein [Bradyrhizobium cenepequi]MCA6108092.1 hypothetical protein [Bradyrhizobium cenepequi]